MCYTGQFTWFCPSCSKTTSQSTRDKICDNPKCQYKKNNSRRGPLPIQEVSHAEPDPCKECSPSSRPVSYTPSRSDAAGSRISDSGSRVLDPRISDSSRVYTINSDYKNISAASTSSRREGGGGESGHGKSQSQSQSRRTGGGGESARTREYIPTPAPADSNYLQIPRQDQGYGSVSGSSINSRSPSRSGSVSGTPSRSDSVSGSRQSGKDDSEPRHGETREHWYKRVTGNTDGYRAYAERALRGNTGNGTSRAPIYGDSRASEATTVIPRSHVDFNPPAYSSRGNGNGGSAQSHHSGSGSANRQVGPVLAGGSSRNAPSAHGGGSSRDASSAHGGSGASSRQGGSTQHADASPTGSPPSYSTVYPGSSASSVGGSSCSTGGRGVEIRIYLS